MIYNRSLKDSYHRSGRNDDKLIPFLMGRSAINYLIVSMQIRTICIPSFICPMVIDVFKHHNIQIFFYEGLNDQLEVPVDKIISTLEGISFSGKLFFLWHDYLSIVGDLPEELYAYCDENGIDPIIDATHTLPIKEYRCLTVVYGFRKLVNSPFGSFLKTSKPQESALKAPPMRRLFFLNLIYQVRRNIILLFNHLDFMWVNKCLKIISSRSGEFGVDLECVFLHDIFKYQKISDQHSRLDYGKIATQRQNNFMHLYNNLPNKFDINKVDVSCPYGFPLLSSENVKLRKYLWKKNIHSLILWNPLHADLQGHNFFYSESLSNSNLVLPVNQDLSEDDLNEIIEAVK